MKKHTFRKKYILLICLFLMVLGALWEHRMEKQEEAQNPMPGAQAVLDSYRAHYYRKGEGESTVVFIAGSGTPCAYTDFYGLQNELSKDYQTISFDHAGSGWSTSTEVKRTVDCLADELFEIIEQAEGKADNLILISHSLGSLEAIRFAQKNPKRVTALIFLDGGSPEFYEKDSEISSILLNRTSAVLRITGVGRLLGKLGFSLPVYGENERDALLPADLKEVERAMFYRYLGNKENISNISQIQENAKAVLENGKLRGIPILVLSSDSGEKWQNVQEELAEWSDNSTQVMIKGAKHYLHWSNQQEVLTQINDFLQH